MAEKVWIYKERVPSTFFSGPPVVPNISIRAQLAPFSNQFYQQAIRALNALGSKPEFIPRSILEDLKKAARMGNEKALDALVTLIRRNTLPNIPTKEKLIILKKFASRHNGAAYECALAYLGMGNFKRPKNYALAKKNFIHAIELGHEAAFAHFLSALCDGNLKVARKDFIDTCNHLVERHRNTEVALTFGALYCGLQIYKRPELTTLFMLNDPNKGFDLLKFVFEQGKQGKNEESDRAWTYIVNGIRRKMFTSDAAREFQRVHNITPAATTPSFKKS